MNFKLKVLPVGYNTIDIIDIHNDNTDIHIILPTGEVFFATLFTLKNIQKLLEGNTYFWAGDMIIVPDLTIKSIKSAINQLIKESWLEEAADRIGTISEIYGEEYNYEGMEDFF